MLEPLVLGNLALSNIMILLQVQESWTLYGTPFPS
jgi:hypothetical protein